MFFFVFLMAYVRAEVDEKDHFCSCIQSTSNLCTCIRMQSLTRNESHLILIERDNLYEIRQSWIDPKQSKIYLRFKESQELIQPSKYYDVPWFIVDPAVYENEIKPMGELKYFGIYGSDVNILSHLRTKQQVVQLHYQFGDTFFCLGGPQDEQPRETSVKRYTWNTTGHQRLLYIT